jgi:hypothetical protein
MILLSIYLIWPDGSFKKGEEQQSQEMLSFYVILLERPKRYQRYVLKKTTIYQ